MTLLPLRWKLRCRVLNPKTINSKTLALDIDQGGKAALSTLRKLYVSVSDSYVSVSDSYGWIMVPLGAVLFTMISWGIIYNDSVVPGVYPPSPFGSPAKPSRNRTGLAWYWNLNYTMPVFIGVITLIIWICP
uniref:Uncharacterized protein n=1 Tax=Timema shepardi TaxID=629360 RepID=A0A7R9B8Y4_TIMSH|nr:unnamed protein product [Timema shepardi]